MNLLYTLNSNVGVLFNAKCACTSLKKFYWDYHQTNISTWLKLDEFDIIAAMSSNYIKKFLLTRNPYYRTVSAYYDKFSGVKFLKKETNLHQTYFFIINYLYCLYIENYSVDDLKKCSNLFYKLPPLSYQKDRIAFDSDGQIVPFDYSGDSIPIICNNFPLNNYYNHFFNTSFYDYVCFLNFLKVNEITIQDDHHLPQTDFTIKLKPYILDKKHLLNKMLDKTEIIHLEDNFTDKIYNFYNNNTKNEDKFKLKKCLNSYFDNKMNQTTYFSKTQSVENYSKWSKQTHLDFFEKNKCFIHPDNLLNDEIKTMINEIYLDDFKLLKYPF